MNDAVTLSVHMLDVLHLTAEASESCGQIVASLHTGGQGVKTHCKAENVADRGQARAG